jgi:hypothetical protein
MSPMPRSVRAVRPCQRPKADSAACRTADHQGKGISGGSRGASDAAGLWRRTRPFQGIVRDPRSPTPGPQKPPWRCPRSRRNLCERAAFATFARLGEAQLCHATPIAKAPTGGRDVLSEKQSGTEIVDLDGAEFLEYRFEGIRLRYSGGEVPPESFAAYSRSLGSPWRVPPPGR